MVIKSIAYYEKNTWIAGHNLIKLYQQISTESKREINNNCKKLYKQSEHAKKIIKQLKKQAAIKVNWNAMALLSLSANAFENWRYAFDLGKKKSCFIGFSELYESFANVNDSLKGIDSK